MNRSAIFTILLFFLLLLGLPSVLLAHDGEHSHEQVDQEVSMPSSEFFTTRESTKVLPLAKESDVFHFVIYGDRTGGVPEGLKVLEQAVADTNLLDPDLVMTVGDLVQGYNETPQWLDQMREYKEIMNRLKMRWFPVAGNHDVYWRGQGKTPEGHHESNYEKHFGPLWYSFAHKNAGFIVLYSDEGDASTNQKSFSSGRLQTMSDEQLTFLKQSLEKLKQVDHVFVFLHHPRWIGGGYSGSNWPVVHEILKDAGNVSAVFAGHIHQMRFDGPPANDPTDQIDYFALATTGGALSADIPGAGYLHHLNLITVRKETISVSALPVGAVIDPKEFTPEFLADINRARTLRPIALDELQLQIDGSASGRINYQLSNTSQRPIDITVSVDRGNDTWRCMPRHTHLTLPAGKSTEMGLAFYRDPTHSESLSIPRLQLDLQYVGESARIQLPTVSAPIPLRLSSVPADFFGPQENKCLEVVGEESAVRVDSSDLKLEDGPFTLEAWVNPSQVAGYRGLIAKTESSEFAFFIDEGVPEFSVHLSGSYKKAKATKLLPTDQWTHLAGVFDGEQVKLFVDGKLAAAVAASGKRSRNQLPLLIGADPDRGGQPTRPFLGKIDEMRISGTARYSEAFTPEQRFAPDDATVLLLHMDRQIGPFLLDHSPQATKATLGPKGGLVPR